MWIVTITRTHRKAPEGSLGTRIAYAGLDYNEALKTAVDESVFMEQKRGYRVYDSDENYEMLTNDLGWVVNIQIQEISKQNW